MNSQHRSVVAVLLVALFLGGACGTAQPTPDIAGSVEANVALIATQTAISQVQTSVAATSVANDATSMALAWTPTTLPAATEPPTPIPATPSPAPTEVPTPISPALSLEATTPPDTITATPVPATPVPPTSAPTLNATSPSKGNACPFYVYAGWGAKANHYVPEGWMGDFSDMKYDPNFKLDPQRPSVIQITYTPKGGNRWAGIYWWDPPGSMWGEQDGGYNLSCAKKLTLWARGEKGGEVAEFKVGGLKGTYQDSLQPALSTGPIKLTGEWTEYSLPLAGQDLTHVIGGFVWVTNADQNPNGATIYLADIRYE